VNFFKIPIIILILGISCVIIAKEQNQEKQFIEAKELFKQQKYADAYESFYVLFLNNLQDPNINFYLGQSSFYIGNYDEAISAYERILFVNDNAVRVKLELARTYIASGSFLKAKDILDELNVLQLPENVQANIDRYFELIEEKETKNSFKAIFIASIGYDDNVKNTSFSTLNNAINGPAASVVKSSLHQELLVLNHSYEKDKKVSFKNDFIILGKSFSKDPSSNMRFIQYSPSMHMVHNNTLSVNYAFLYNNIWMDSKLLLKNFAFEPRVTYIYTPQATFNLSAKLQNKMFVNSSTNPDIKKRDTYSGALQLEGSYLYSKLLKSSMQLRYVNEIRKKADVSITNVTNQLIDVIAYSEYKMTDKLSLLLKGAYQYREYSDENRKDNEYKATLNTTYALDKSYLLQGVYERTKHDSNDVNMEYDKSTFMLNLITLF